MRRLLPIVLWFALGLPLFAGSGGADAGLSSWWNGPGVTGDWDGWRARLFEEGFNPYLYYTAIALDKPAGGLDSGSPKYAHDINLGLTLDLQKLAGWDGTTFNINGVERAGHTIRPQAGSVYDPVQIFGGQTVTLYNVTLEQQLPGDLGSFKLGRMSPGDDFAESPLYNYYANNGIDGQIRAVIFDTRFYTYPFPTWGARLRLNASPEWNVMTGIFSVSDHVTARWNHGLDFALSGDDGFQFVNQVSWTPTFDAELEHGKPKASTGLPGHYFVGGYFSNSNYPQFGTSVKTRLSYGVYAHADQMIYRPVPGSDAGLTVLGMIAYDPQPSVAIVPYQFSGGALYQGLLPSRPKDMVIFGVIHGHLSSDYAEAVPQPRGGRPTSETDLEFGYRVQVNPFTYVQPDIQYIVRPGGTGNVPDAVLIGAQFGLTF